MAQPGAPEDSHARELEIVEFYIDETDSEGTAYRGHYGINVAKVLEIIRRPPVTEMPSAPHPSVLGAFNQRNRVIPLVDLNLDKEPFLTEYLQITFRCSDSRLWVTLGKLRSNLAFQTC